MKTHISVLVAAALALGAAGSAMAQSAQDAAQSRIEKPDELENIVVTARRVEERLQDVPISITVFDQRALTDRNVSDAQDLVNYTTSMSTNARFGSENATFALRGFSQDIGTAPSVGVYFADVVAPRGFGQGIPAGDGAGPGSFFDLQNVQVLKGPQGTLFGRNTTGGAILLVPQKPTDKLEGYVEGGVGTYDMRRVQAVVNLPLSQTIRLRLGVDRQKRDGYLINDSGIGPHAFNDIDYVAVRGSLVADITPDLENYTIASFNDSKNNGSLQKLFACYPNTSPAVALFTTEACAVNAAEQARGFYHTVSDLPNPVSKLRDWQVINTTTWRASDTQTVKNIISYARLQDTLDTPLYGTQFFIPTGPNFLGNVPLTFINVRTAPGAYLADQATLTEELQFQGSALGNRLKWQGGGYFEDSKPMSLIGTQPPISISCTDPATLHCIDLSVLAPPFQPQGAVTSNRGRTYFRSEAIYAQSTYELTKQIKLTGGLRYTWDRMWAIGQESRWVFPVLFGPPVYSCTQPGASLPDCQIYLSKSSRAPTWLIGIDYNPLEDVLLYAKYSRGYRTGGVKTDAPLQVATFQPEKLDSYEIGAKTTFSGAIRGTFNVAAFYNDFNNQQIQYGFSQNYDRRDANGNPLPLFPIAPSAGPVNVGKSRIWGIELDTQLHVAEGLVLNASYSYLNTKVLSVTPTTLPSDSPFVIQGDIVPGDTLPFSPRHKLSVGPTYTLPLAKNVGEISIAALYTYTSSQIASYGLRQPAIASYFGRDLGILGDRNLIDLYVNWRSVGGGPIDLGLFVNNLTDRKYYIGVSGYADNLGFAVAGVGQPRMFGVRAKFTFGR